MQKICAVFSSYDEVENAVIYGSRAKGTYKPYSDIDLALSGSGITLSLAAKIETDIDYLYLPYKVDLNIMNKITNGALIEHINRVGKLFYMEPAGKD